MKKYLFLILMLPLIVGCIESKKAGDQNRALISGALNTLDTQFPGTAYQQLAEEAKENLANPPKLIDGKAILDGAKSAAKIFVPAVGTIFGIPPVVYMPIIAAALKTGEVLLAKKKQLAKAELDEEIAKELPKENHDIYEKAKANGIKRIKEKKNKGAG